MAFVNTSDPPGEHGAGFPAGEPPRDEGGNSAGPSARAITAARAATSRYRRTPAGMGKYAWAISLGLHAIVLVGAYIAVRYYFPNTQAGAPIASAPAESSGPDLIISGPDATDAVHGGWTGGWVLSDGSAIQPGDPSEIPPTIAREPQTVITLQDLAPRSGMETAGSRLVHDLTPPAAIGPKTAAARPKSF